MCVKKLVTRIGRRVSFMFRCHRRSIGYLCLVLSFLIEFAAISVLDNAMKPDLATAAIQMGIGLVIAFVGVFGCKLYETPKPHRYLWKELGEWEEAQDYED